MTTVAAWFGQAALVMLESLYVLLFELLLDQYDPSGCHI